MVKNVSPGQSPAPAPDAKEPTADEDTRQRLLAAAGPVFAAVGFNKATVREICRLAGVNVASIGYHFGDKMGLYLEVIRQLRAKREQANPLPDDPQSTPQTRLRERVRVLLTRVMSCPDDDHWEAQLMMREMQNPTLAFEELVRDYFKPVFDQLTDILADLSPADVQAATLHRLAFSVVGQCIYYRFGAKAIGQLLPAAEIRDELNIEVLVDHITAVMLATVSSPLVFQVSGQTPTEFLTKPSTSHK